MAWTSIFCEGGTLKRLSMALASQGEPGTKHPPPYSVLTRFVRDRDQAIFFSLERGSRWTGGLISNYPSCSSRRINRNVFTSKSCDGSCSTLSRSFHVYRTSPGLNPKHSSLFKRHGE